MSGPDNNFNLNQAWCALAQPYLHILPKTPLQNLNHTSKDKNETKRTSSRKIAPWGSIWEGSGSLWGAFWALLAASWALWGVSWPFFGRSKSSFFQALAQNGLQKSFWMDLGSLWEGFGRVWGEILEDFGPFEHIVGRFWKCFA